MPDAFAISLRLRGTSVRRQAAYVDAATIPLIGRPLTRPLLSARRYIRAARSVTTSGRLSRPASPRNWLIALERLRAIDDPAEARSCVRLSRQSCSLSSELSDLFDAWALEIMVERFLSKAENLPGGPDWLSSIPSSVRLGTGAAYCSVGSDRTKPQLVHMTSPVSASRTKLGLPQLGQT